MNAGRVLMKMESRRTQARLGDVIPDVGGKAIMQRYVCESVT